MTTVSLPRLHWGEPSAPRRALLVHGLGSSAATMWFLAEGLAAAGWSATAVDLRGHENAPRASRYRIEDFAADVRATRADHGNAWDLVLGHSIGAAAATQAAGTVDDSTRGAWTRRLVLLDPALALDTAARQAILEAQLANFDGATVEGIAAQFPHWHPLDVEFRVRAVTSASRFALERAVLDNEDWDVTASVPHVSAPTLIIAADPEHGSLFAGDHAAAVLAANPLFEQVVLPGAGHSVHRDQPAETLQRILAWLNAP
ncbi:MAG: alpha/beta hydrolase [Microcella sp.]|uniref:alpha/beta fold hydrolase n=1 Tax=Microcella sp. TaxID=1913979 RepID=UPI003316400E